MDEEGIIIIMLGALQGITEVFPISSSGHLVLIQQLMAVRQFDLSLVAGLHFGSLIGIFTFYRHDLTSMWRSVQASWRRIIISNFRDRAHPFARMGKYRVPYYLALSLIPVAIGGLLLEDTATQTFKQGALVALLLTLNGVIIFLTASLARGERMLHQLRLWEYLLIGAVQGLAVLPGISRLGLTLCMGLWLGLNWYEALRLTFILAIPVILGANILLPLNNISQSIGNLQDGAAGFVFGIAMATLLSYFGLKMFTSSKLERHTLGFFGSYCIMLGLFTLTIFIGWY